MHLGMTIHAALPHDETRARRISTIKIQQATHMTTALGANILVALLAQLRALTIEQRGVIRAMGFMTQAAVLGDRVMFPQEGTALVCMAAKTGVVDTEFF